MTRIVITGGPRTGKTTLAHHIVDNPYDYKISDFELPTVRHTDDLIEQCKHLGKDGWSEASRLASEWLNEPGTWIIEGVAASRALRKWRESHPGERPPVDRVIYLDKPHETLTKGQATMAKGVRTVHDEIESWLEDHSIKTEYL